MRAVVVHDSANVQIDGLEINMLTQFSWAPVDTVGAALYLYSVGELSVTNVAINGLDVRVFWVGRGVCLSRRRRGCYLGCCAVATRSVVTRYRYGLQISSTSGMITGGAVAVLLSNPPVAKVAYLRAITVNNMCVNSMAWPSAAQRCARRAMLLCVCVCV